MPSAAGEQVLDVDSHRVILYEPDRLGDAPAPLVLALHGGGGNAKQFRRVLKLDRQASRFGFRVAYVDGAPFGRGGRSFTWNAGGCCGPAVRRADDDVATLTEVITALQGRTGNNPVWLVGHSNGGIMSYRMACERGDLIDGIVPVAGALMVDDCPKARGVQVIHIHGTDDRNLPIDGGKGPDSLTRLSYPSAADTMAGITGAGAEARLLTIEGASHQFQELDRMTRAQTGKAIAGWVAQAVTGD